GKSTFLRILSGQLEPTNGYVSITPGQRLSVLEQDQNKYDDQIVMDAVLQGNARLFEIMKEKEVIYAKTDFTDEDGEKAAELEAEFAEMNGWEAESDAASLLNGLGIEEDRHYMLVGDLPGADKVKVLLARALFGSPDILLLDEPTNHLDLAAISWLEEWLINFDNTVIVVSHDRYFLNKVCTAIADVDYNKIQLYSGNYDFWYESSQLMIRQMKEANRKKEEKIKELQEFIQRFSANASKSKQATSRKRALEKIQLDEIRPSSRKYPYIDFRPDREIGNDVLMVENLSKTINGVKVLDNVSFTLNREDKVAFVGSDEFAKTTLFKILMGEMEPDSGSYKWGVTTTQSYFPKDSNSEFQSDLRIYDWLQQYSPVKDITYVRGFLGRMLFAGEDGEKRVRVLSGGEKVRCMLSKMMISGSNVLIFDEPTNHLDMESITALNQGMMKFPGVILFACRDHQLVQTTANRIIEFLPGGMIDKMTTYDEYLASDEMAMKRQIYTVTETEEENEEEA
ncbi:MAG: ATP-binding cassette domain-containing protein, partial [Lachnospiraceae bacterium]|nr:ATP-binding cassette domain-containing protein [Lachnospiraceae bacterium]